MCRARKKDNGTRLGYKNNNDICSPEAVEDRNDEVIKQKKKGYGHCTMTASTIEGKLRSQVRAAAPRTLKRPAWSLVVYDPRVRIRSLERLCPPSVLHPACDR